MDLMLLRRRILFAAGGLKKYIVTAASGIVSFVTNVVHTTKVVCEFSPVQSGTGDPSPSNVRAISGWNGCNIKSIGLPSGYTAFDHVVLSQTISIETSFSFNRDDLVIYCNFMKGSFVQYGTIYSVYTGENDNTTRIIEGSTNIATVFCNNVKASGSPSKTGIDRSVYHDIVNIHGKYIIDGTEYTYTPTAGNAQTSQTLKMSNTGGVSFRSFKIVESTNGTTLMCLVPCTNASGVAGLYDVVSGNFYTTADPTKAVASGTFGKRDYTYSTNIPIDWSSSPGTVYGGTVTLNEDGSADLVVTHRYIDVNPNDASLNADKDTIVWAQIGLSSGYYGASSNKNIYSNIFTNKGYQTIYGSQTSVSGNRILVGLPAEYDTTALVKQFFTDNPTQFVYKLATEQTYHFSNIGALQSFIGQNAIWHDMNGSITVEYYKNT